MYNVLNFREDPMTPFLSYLTHAFLRPLHPKQDQQLPENPIVDNLAHVYCHLVDYQCLTLISKMKVLFVGQHAARLLWLLQNGDFI